MIKLLLRFIVLVFVMNIVYSVCISVNVFLSLLHCCGC